ncbi:SDR family NAD(P)-dependent oxidoreductase [Niabella drilacis]|uniref:NAD(P)-dependent dehydrogenase, short-chain alcohol dehydrogenase family n=1 Tax=Niabella drilacis (strain DSM 25811 / CCM 8410 / CCUG 62505 / LMG 26954 / E90) TaxID=1285928 RepID=A0A1G6RKR9_NIADE|nr:SDR family oxidoreductase [Niabella drilacis]SDD04595.1 NAD(P)-dependent dehydrogenase, short-chain alcohol dehydrogenase family [Niabella drilacis]
MQLKDKVVFLTGGSTGIGLCCARAYAKEGARVIIFAPESDQVQDAVKQLGAGHLGIVGNVAVSASVQAAISEAVAMYGKIDVIHNNAGIASPSKPLHLTSEEEFDTLINVNVKGIFHTTRHGIAALIKTAGTIINTSSLVGEIGQELHAVYTATKGAVNALTKSMALDYAPHRIRVNAVAPAGVWTPMLKKWCKEQPHPETMEKYLNDIHVLGYCPEGDVIADACVFLASARAAFITGCIFPVTGGAELGYRRSSGETLLG